MKKYFFYVSYPIINMKVDLDNPVHVELIKFMQKTDNDNGLDEWSKSETSKARRLMKKAGLFEVDKDGKQYTGTCSKHYIDLSFREGKYDEVAKNFEEGTFIWIDENEIKV